MMRVGWVWTAGPAAAVVDVVGSRYRFGYRWNYVSSVLAALVG